MQENEIKEQEKAVETATTDVEENQTENIDNDTLDESGNQNDKNDVEKTFNQEQVNNFVRERLNKFYKRYGVENKQGLDDLIGKAKSYEIMEERYNNMLGELSTTKELNAFLKNNINPEKYDDVRAHFKGKEIELNEENLISELANHGEWVNIAKETTPQTTIKTMGADASIQSNKKSEKEIAEKYFGMKFR